MRLILVDEPIVCLRCAEAVVIDLVAFVPGGEIMTSLGRVIAAVKETVVEPGQAGNLQPLEVVFKHRSGSDFQNAAFEPIRTAAGKIVGKVASILGCFPSHEAHSAVGRELVGINQNARWASEAVLHIEYALILQAIIFRPQVIGSASARNAVLGVVIEFLQALLEERT